MPLLVSYLALCLGESNESTNVYYISYVCARMPGEWVAHGCVRPTPCGPLTALTGVGPLWTRPPMSSIRSALRASATRWDGRGSSASGETARHPTAHWLAGLKKGQERSERGQGQIPAGSNKNHNMRITAFSSPLTCSSPPLSTPHRRVWNRSEHGVGGPWRWRTSPIGRRKSSG